MRHQAPTLEEIGQLHAQALELSAPTFYDRLETATDQQERQEIRATIDIAESVRDLGGMALVVGGYVRDEILRRQGWNCEPKDIDVEVFGLDIDELADLLSQKGEVNAVGKAFQVLKFEGLDVSIPRTDTKVGTTHKGFETVGRPDFSVKEAAARRDLTINALSLNPLTGQIVDEIGGVQDIKNGVLRAVDENTFREDSLRVLRVMQFAGRFEFEVDRDTADLCRSLDLSEIPKSRIGEEWIKLLTKSPKPSIGMEAGRELGIIEKLHPELHALVGCPQDPEWHPEGDVWTHTKMVVDEAAAIVRREGLKDDDAEVIMLAALTHDYGKPSTTRHDPERNRITSRGHAEAGVKPAKNFMKLLEISHKLINRVLPLVEDHMYPAAYPDASAKAIRRLAARLSPGSIQELVWVAEADQRGRATDWQGYPSPNLAEKAAELHVDQEPEERMVLGRHLIPEGVEPGPALGELVRQLYEAQQDGEFRDTEGGLAYYRAHLAEQS